MKSNTLSHSNPVPLNVPNNYIKKLDYHDNPIDVVRCYGDTHYTSDFSEPIFSESNVPENDSDVFEDNVSDNASDDNFSEDNISFSVSPDNTFSGSPDNPYKRITRRIDSTKIRSHQKRDVEVSISTTHEVNTIRDVPVRAGAIIYTKYHGITYFCLGIDTESGNLTDFGGGVKKGESIIEGGLRELEEESQGVFGHMVPDDIENTVTFHSYNMAITFIPLEVNPRSVTEMFKQKIKNKENPEVCDITWLNTEEFLESIHGRGKKLYIRVRKLLNKVTSTITEL